jgi:hypothetical protein
MSMVRSMCNEQCYFIRQFVKMYKNPLYAVIPEFEEYFKSLDKDARTCYRKAIKAGCKIRKVENITDMLYDDVLEIYTSKTERQGRLMNTLYHLVEGGDYDIREGWPHEEYKKDCDKHYFDFYGCFIGDKLVAFLELLHSNELAVTYSTMGHADYLNKGIMKFMFMEVIRIAKLKYLQYGDLNSKASMGYFLSDLRINNCNPEFTYSLSNE